MFIAVIAVRVVCTLHSCVNCGKAVQCFRWRKRTVQKDVQYVYIHKCLRDYIAAQQSEYSS